MKNIIVIKIGGSTFGSGDTTIEDIVALQKQGKSLVVVHGGGNAVTDWLKRQGVATKFVRGERVTDKPTLEVATAVLSGLVNKEITAAINVHGGRACGISGVDGALIESRVNNPDMGYVGAVAKVNPAVLEALLKAGFVPVVSPVSLYAVDRPEDAPLLVNVNGDPVAGDIAAALKAARLVFLTDVAGIADASGKVLSRLSVNEAEALIVSGVISGGMIPKVNACLKALKTGAAARIIDGRKPHALLKEVEGGQGGTEIYSDVNWGWNMSVINISSFVAFCKGLEGKKLPTIGGRKEFILESVENNGLTYIPESTGKRRGEDRRYIENILNRYTIIKSLHPKDYQDITVNASYDLTLIKKYSER